MSVFKRIGCFDECTCPAPAGTTDIVRARDCRAAVDARGSSWSLLGVRGRTPFASDVMSAVTSAAFRSARDVAARAGGAGIASRSVTFRCVVLREEEGAAAADEATAPGAVLAGLRCSASVASRRCALLWLIPLVSLSSCVARPLPLTS